MRTNATMIKVEAHTTSPGGKMIGTTQKKLPEISPYPSMKEVEWIDLKIPLNKNLNLMEDLYLIFFSNKKQSIRTYHSIAEIQKITFENTTD